MTGRTGEGVEATLLITVDDTHTGWDGMGSATVQEITFCHTVR